MIVFKIKEVLMIMLSLKQRLKATSQHISLGNSDLKLVEGLTTHENITECENPTEE